MLFLALAASPRTHAAAASPAPAARCSALRLVLAVRGLSLVG
ncbi:hypothetical protein ABZW10_33800 [Kitasatospora sp. NPDC004723]